ncbi:MAG: response regulator [Planctomycetaceae bacterium]|nr:response regulator [Planctomycetaceae bacterium]
MEQASESVCLCQDGYHEATLAAVTRLGELSTRLIQAGNLHALLKEILAAAAEISKTDKGSIQFLDPSTNHLRIVIHQGLSPKFIEYFAEKGFAGSCEEAKLTKSRVVLEDISKFPISENPELGVILEEGIRAVQCSPLISREGRVLGMLNNHFSAPHYPTEHEKRFLDVLARMAADLIERKQVEEKLQISYNQMEDRVRRRTAELDAQNLELHNRADQLSRLACEITLAEEQERHRLAHVLHDHLQQILVAAKLELSVLARKVEENELQTIIADVSGLIEESIRESRNLTVELSPPILHEAGLPAGLQWLGRRMQNKYGFEVKMDISPEVELKRDDVSILCFQSVRELLFNSVKHSGVKSASISMHYNPEQDLLLTVSDKGRGFDPERVWSRTAGCSGGFGLFSIRERLSMLGGNFTIDSKPGGGSTFRLTIPRAALRGMRMEKRDQADADQDASAAAERKIRLLLVDDHNVMRRGLASMLRQETDIEIVGEAENGAEAIEKSRHLLPDVILMDFSMPRMNGLDATRIIHNELPQIRIIGLSMFDEAERAAAMLHAGASAYTAKCEPPEVILSAIRKVFNVRKAHAGEKGSSEAVPIRIASRQGVPVRVKKSTLAEQAQAAQAHLFD